MNFLEKGQGLPFSPFQGDTEVEIELNQVPISWDLDKGCLSFFGLDSALFWTDPSLVRTLAPLSEEIGVDLFRLLISHSSSLGTEEDYHAMVSTLGENFPDGFLAWGKAVSGAGWGTFELLDYNPVVQQATVTVHNPWELSMQRNLSVEKRWGCPFLLGKIIGIFSHAFNTPCWAEDNCHYDPDHSRVTFRIYPSSTTIQKELKKFRYERMLSRERTLAEEVEHQTARLSQAQEDLEEYSRSLEQKVSERTAELQNALTQLEAEKEKLKHSGLLLQEREKELSELVEESPIAIFTSTPDGKLLRSNKVLLNLFGLSRFEDVQVEKFSLRDFYVNPEDREKLVDEILWEEKVSKKEVRFKFPEKDVWLQISMRKVQKENGNVEFEGFAQDITAEKKALEDLKESKEQLKFEVYHDPLTGLGNRRLCMKTIREYQTGHHQDILCVIFFDIDQFKDINHAYGYHTGDKILSQIGKRFINVFGSKDKVFRISGDHFVALDTGLSREQSFSLAAKIKEALSLPFVINGEKIAMRVSLGLTFCEGEEEEPEMIVSRAALAHNDARSNEKGGNVVYDDTLHNRYLRRKTIDKLIPTGLANNEFRLEYQPVMNIQKDRLYGFEALLRWDSRQLGVIGPSEFIPIAEDSGQIAAIGEWVLMQGLRFWKEAGLAKRGLVMSTNVSGKQFARQGFFSHLESVVQRTEVPPRLIKLEITETALMHNAKETIFKLEALRKLGVQISIDDFGTGYSSLEYLRQFPVDTLKIDMSFVQQLEKGNKTCEVVRAMINLAGTFDMDVVGEGVETENQKLLLQELGCHYHQGYLYSRPIRQENLIEYLGKDLT